jgi:pimeloyl-ACP methyl ester carboxylesterase
MALKFATAYPERVTALVLIASAGLAQVRPQFIHNVEQARQTDGTMPVTSDITGEHNIPKEVIEFMNLIVESYNPIQELPVFANEQLLRLNIAGSLS